MHSHAAKATILFFLVSILVLMSSGRNIPSHCISANAWAKQETDVTVQNVTFRLLAVESRLSNVTIRSAEYLIKCLTSFTNWQNNTASDGLRYFNYIRLLSNVDLSEIDEYCEPFYEGKATRENLLDEISTFLTQKLPNENDTLSVRMLYYVGDAHKIVNRGNTSYCLALDQPVYDWELDRALNQDGNVEPPNTLVMLDACYSGGYLSKMAQLGRIVLTACSPTETIEANIDTENQNRGGWTWFTGAKSAAYRNGTAFGPLGIIGGMETAEDSNHDGWRSAGEIFRFASQTTKWYAANQTNPENGEPSNLNPWANYGIAGGAIPLVQCDPSMPFPHGGKPFLDTPQSADPYAYDSEEFECRMFRYSPTHAEAPFAKGPSTPTILWTRYLSAPIAGSASVADGIIFIGTLDGTLHALDMTTGETIWNFSAGSPISSTPAIEEETVVFGSQEPGKVYAIDEYTGTVRWTYEIPEAGPVHQSSFLSSPTVINNRVFVGSSEGRLRVFSLVEGSLILESYVEGNITSPAVSGDTIYITGNDVQALNASSGTRKWLFQTNWPVSSSPAVEGEVVYIGSGNDDTVFALDTATGTPIWAYKTGGWFSSPCVDSEKNLLFLGCRNGRVYCLDKRTGFVKWEYITEGANHMSTPTISTNGLVYVGSLNNNFFCFEEETGQKIWNYTASGPIASSPTIIDEHVIIGTLNGYLYCFGPSFPSHDVAVLNATTSSKVVRPGELVEISYSARNLGNVAETVEILCSCNRSNAWTSPEYLEPQIFHRETLTINSGETISKTCFLNTSSLKPGEYTIVVQATSATDELEASNNTFLNGPIQLQIMTDLDADGIVNIIDIAIVAKAFGSQPGNENWNADADLDRNEVINIIDIALVAKDFGRIW